MENRRIQRPSLKIKFKPYLALRGRIFSISNLELIDYIRELLESNPFVEETNIVDVDSFYIENATRDDEDLYSFLDHQINMLEIEPCEKEIAEAIISNIDEDGYLRVSIEDIAKKWNFDLRKCREVLKLVQSLDPPGVAARNLSECFILQLEREEKLSPKVKRIIKENLEELAKLPLEVAEKKLKITKEEIINLRERIVNLNPSPGFAFREPNEIAKVPDLVVDKDDGEFKIYLNKSFRKEFLLARNYEAILKKIEDKECKKEFQEFLEQAMWSKQAIENRDNLLLEIGKKLLENNIDFFKKEKPYPEKFSLEEFSKAFGLDYSVVSRLIQNKYIKCPRGILPLHFFVRHKLTAFNDEEIKNKIREFVEKEDKKKPLTDEELEGMLKKEGFSIKRRTINKYRSLLNIPPASKRRIDY